MKKIAIVGATGLVGQEMQRILREDVALKDWECLLFASKDRPDENVLSLNSHWAELAECSYVLGASSSEVARLVKENLRSHQVFIDNSSYFRMDPEVPLVVPEVNGELLQSKPRVVANPNCTAILLTMTLEPLKEFGIKRVNVATYQAASGAGLEGLEELSGQLKDQAEGREAKVGRVFPFVLAGNVMSHNSKLRPQGEIGGGYNDEEWKVIEETRKILNILHLPISATCMRVPVERAHTEAVSVDLSVEEKLETIANKWRSSPGLKWVDDPVKNHFPMPLESQNQDEVFVGRLRKDAALSKTVHYILSGDQIRKGAALNAIQILKKYISFQ